MPHRRPPSWAPARVRCGRPGGNHDAYEHFFQSYDKGQQEFEYHFKVGDLGTEMGWLMASGNVKCKKSGKASTFPLNLSLTVAKSGGDWKIASMHFSTLTGPDKATKATKAAK